MGRHENDIALFLSCVDIPVGFGSLFQRIASIDDRFYLSRLNQLCKENVNLQWFHLLAAPRL